MGTSGAQEWCPRVESHKALSSVSRMWRDLAITEALAGHFPRASLAMGEGAGLRDLLLVYLSHQSRPGDLVHSCSAGFRKKAKQKPFVSIFMSDSTTRPKIKK